MHYTPEQLTNVIRTPAGPCPVKMGMFCDLCKHQCPPSPVIISAWFWEVRDFGLRRGEFLTAEAIAYYARYEFPPTGDDYHEIERVIFEYAREIGDPFSPQTKEREATEHAICKSE